MHERERVYNAHSFRTDRGDPCQCEQKPESVWPRPLPECRTEFIEREDRDHG